MLPETGIYEIHVGTDFGCAGTLGSYALAVDDGPSLEEVDRPWTESASFSAQFSEVAP